MDFLSPLFARFALHARVFYAGQLCNNIDFTQHDNLSYLHVVRNGRLRVTHPGAGPLDIDKPTLLFYPRASAHGFRARDAVGAEAVCASIEFGAMFGNPLLRGLPELVVLDLHAMPGIAKTLELLFDEAFAARVGRAAAVDRLAEYFVVLMLRHFIDAKLMRNGTLAALADERLAKSIHAMHERPEHMWSIESLASVAGMSRARYADLFRETTGVTPIDYLTDWRIGLARTLLKRGEQLKWVAPKVGYLSPSALSRAFARRVGVSPAQWAAGLSESSLDSSTDASPYVTPAKS